MNDAEAGRQCALAEKGIPGHSLSTDAWAASLQILNQRVELVILIGIRSLLLLKDLLGAVGAVDDMEVSLNPVLQFPSCADLVNLPNCKMGYYHNTCFFRLLGGGGYSLNKTTGVKWSAQCLDQRRH